MQFIGAVMRSIPRFLGGSRDADMEADFTEREGVAIVRPTLETGVFARLGRGVAGLLVGRPAFDELERRHRDSVRTTEALEARNRTLATLQVMIDSITHSLDFGNTAQRIVDAVVAHTDFGAAALYSEGEDAGRFECSATCESEDVALPPLPATVVRRLVERAREKGRVLRSAWPGDLGEAHAAVREYLSASGDREVVVVPLLFHGDVVGLLSLTGLGARRPGGEEEDSFLTLGKTAAAALR